MPRVRVLQVLEATEGGTLTHVRDLALGLDRQRFEVDVGFSLRRDPAGLLPTLDRLRDAGLRLLPVPMERDLRPVDDIAALARLRWWIRRGGYDIVHTHSSKAGFLGRLAARLERVPVVLYTPNAFRFQAPGLGWLERRLVILLECLAAHWGDAVVTVSTGERRAALRCHIETPARLHLIPNGIDLAPLEADAASGGGRDVMGVADDGLVVLTVGRRVPQKGDRDLLEAWPQVVAAQPDAVLVIVGGGPLESELRRQAERLGIAASVRFLPRQERVGRLYAAADLFVLPSLYEGCPYALLEAMGLRLACVATAVEGSRDLIHNGSNGLLVPPADPAALGAALAHLATRPELRSRYGRAAAELVRAEYTAARMVRRTAALYDELLSVARRREQRR